ncbi:putative NBD/HSP70 family sugar kinase [Streptosporangium becharense]|uniref:Putative NBD/HSP70 family sugar kinase n=1 Tax=Streptosporangium becharense TaxID=1816182 RepID=A0A7W9ID86_9ACTN|nr:ROK family protein [Streptosporangium becharense]MBB2912037.1 putative NBD/HSP70 family sugar kinase [Streptosporangium becharense]MBB5818584.1 putative NBD/HSP70 family sugar kinase [Streptosporangium becharense]
MVREGNGSNAGAGVLLRILRDGRPRTRAELVQLTGLARSTLTQRLDALVSREWILPAGEAVSSGGRPAVAFAFNRGARVVLAADLGATHARVAVTDLGGEILAEHSAEIAVDRGPEETLGRLHRTFEEMLAGTGRTRRDVCGVGVGLPGPVEHSSGRPVNPPIMPGWDGFPVPEWLGSRFDAPVLVDNDVNIMALGEHWAARPATDHLIFIKIGTGIGCGVISGRRLHRGAQGAAGDIGHIRVTSALDTVCRCGNVGCLEAVAGGAALAARLRADGVEARDSRDVIRLVRGGNTRAVQLIRQAGREVGDVLASIVNFFNPSVIVVGGDIAEAGEQVLAGLREVIYSRSLPLATQHLTIAASELGDRAGVVGAAVMVIEHVLAPGTVDESFATA